MGKKGVRPQKGQPETDWGEPKTTKLNVGLTPTGKRLVRERANQLGISVSEVLERWARGIEVDNDNPPVVESFTPPPTVESILASLSRYSRQQIGRIVRAGLDLLIGAPIPKPTPAPETLSDLVKSNYFELIHSGKLKPDRVKALAFGENPTTAELAIISYVLEVAEEFVVELRDRSFPQNAKPKPKQPNGTP